MIFKPALILFAAISFVATPQAADLPKDPIISVIGNPLGPPKRLSRAEARLIFSANIKTWPNGTPVSIVSMKRGSLERSRFSHQVLNLYEYQLDRCLQRKIYSGHGDGNILFVNSPKEMIGVVESTPGAIGYVEETYLVDRRAIIEVAQ